MKIRHVIALAAVALFALAACGQTSPGVQLPPAGSGQEVCGPLDSGKIDATGDPVTVTITAPEGKLIDSYCVKAGSDQSVPEGAVQYVNVDPPQKSVTFSHPSGKAISHYSYSWVDEPVRTTVPETTVPETTVPETTVPETTIPETTVPETTVPETTVPETTVPETTVRPTTVPSTLPVTE